MAKDAQLQVDVNVDDAVAQVNAATERFERANAAAAALLDRTEAIALRLENLSGAVRITGGKPQVLEDPKRGFASYGHFALAVARHYRGQSDKRLEIMAAAPATTGSELDGADGGFAVPPEFAAEIGVLVYDSSFIALCDEQETEGYSMTFPEDADPPWTGAPGVSAQWQIEAAAGTQQKPLLTAMEMRLHKLFALVPVTNELLDDASAMARYLPRKSATAITWRFNDAILQGTGAGMPAGILGAKCTILQAKDSGQTTQTVSVTNASNMLSRLVPGSHGRAVYFTNVSDSSQLTSLGQAASGYGLTYSGDVVPGTKIPMIARLLGRPLIPTAHLPNLTSQGDLVLADMTYYRTLVRAGGIETAWSLHLFFDADTGCFKARFRCDGQPILPAALPNPNAGGATLSPFIQLASR